MKTHPLALVLALVLVLEKSADAAGFTEPPIIFYGKVTNDFDGYSVDLTQGELTFTVQPTTGAPLTFTTALDAIGGGYAYRLKIPVEKVPAGFTFTTGSIAAPAVSTSYPRTATLDGNAAIITLPALPAGGTFTFAENQRGKIQRVDLALTAPFEDTDGDGMPDWWEIQNGLDPTDASDAISDSDGDTANALTEYREHTLPTVYEYDYRRWAAQHNLTGADFPMTADPDHDGIPNGIEFAVDTDPHVPDAPLANARIASGVQQISGASYFTLNVTKPALRRTRANYISEASTDLLSWGAVEGTDLVTSENTQLALRVRSTSPLTGAAATTRTFFRFRIQETP